MKESYVKGLANHDGPESCVEWSNPLGEALTGESAGWVLSREKGLVRDADLVEVGGRQQPTNRNGKGRWYPARSETPAGTETTCARTGRSWSHPSGDAWVAS
jgi:hypothetical protein